MADIPVQVRITADTDQAVAGIKKVDAAVDGLATSAQAAQARSKGLVTSFNTAGVSAALASNKTRMLTQQFSQVAQQSVATGQVVQALAIQAADIGLAFGTVGTVVGALAGIALPTLISAFASAEDQGEQLKATMEGLSEASNQADEILGRLRMSVDELVEQYGVAAVRVREFSLAQAELFAAQTERRLRDQIGLVQQLSAEYTETTRGNIGNIAALRRDFKVTTDQARILFTEFRRLENAATFEDQQAQLQNILSTLRDMQVDLGEIPPELNLALQEMLALGIETDRVRELMAQLGAEARNVNVGSSFPGVFDAYGNVALPPQKSKGRGGRGGGGGGQSRSRITALLESLQTERETLEAWRVESMDLLAKANAAELEAIGGHAEAKLRIEQEYQERLRGIRDSERSATLGGYESMFGSLAQVFAAGGERALKISKAFGLAEAGISIARGAAKALELPFPANLGAWATVISTGAQALQSIRSASPGNPGGISSGGAGAAATPSAPATQNVVLDLRNATPDTTRQVSGLVEMINEAGRQGYVLDIRTAR